MLALLAGPALVFAAEAPLVITTKRTIVRLFEPGADGAREVGAIGRAALDGLRGRTGGDEWPDYVWLRVPEGVAGVKPRDYLVLRKEVTAKEDCKLAAAPIPHDRGTTNFVSGSGDLCPR